MIKKTIYTVALIGLFAAPAIAQTTDTASNDSIMNSSISNDSLQQALNTLEEENKRLEEEARNKKIWNDHAKYFNISYVKQSLSIQDANCTWNNDLGAAITWGRTYYLHKKPILGMIKFGFDWSFLDINVAMYEDKFGVYGDGGNGGYVNDNYYDASEEYPVYDNGYEDEYYGDEEYQDGPTKMYQAEVGMQFGPSLTINPVNHLKLSGYFRVTPSYSLLYDGDDVSGSYGTFFSAGGAISYKAISFGIEGRWGETQYNSIMGGDDEGDEEYAEPTPKFKIGSTRAYISFRF